MKPRADFDASSFVAAGWQPFVERECAKPYMQDLVTFLVEQRRAGKVVFPPSDHILRALADVDPDQVKVVILGQDPYHGPGQANGMCFAVNNGQATPPSLRNIFVELARDLGVPGPFDPTLLGWSSQGVLLLNTVLTVEQGLAHSHRNRGWEQFTAAVVDEVCKRADHAVFILWGGAAGSHRPRIDEGRHHVIQSPHPSPLSAHRGFFGSRPFSRANTFLESCGLGPVQWACPANTVATLAAVSALGLSRPPDVV